MASNSTNTGLPKPQIDFLKKINPAPNNYVKAVVHHYDAGQEKGLPHHFMVQFDDRLMGSAELARRELETEVLPWITERERINGECNGRGYRPSVAFSVFSRPSPHLHYGFNLPVVGE
jgi:hypothetical protein